MMAFDECPPGDAPKEYAAKSLALTERWLDRCFNQYHKTQPKYGHYQSLFPIVQGCGYPDLRAKAAENVLQYNADGYAIGGLAVGEPKEDMYRVISAVEPYAPKDKIRYLMGVGTPGNILEAVSRGVDLFDCVMPSRNARHGHLFTWNGIINLNNAKYANDDTPIDPECNCPTCQKHSRAYLHHLFKAKEMLAMRLCVMHNLYFFNSLMEEIRQAIEEDRFHEYKKQKLEDFKRSGMK